MADALLIINAGSSSIKFALFPLLKEIPDRPALSGQIDGIGSRPHLVATGDAGTVLDDLELPLAGTAESQHRGRAPLRSAARLWHCRCCSGADVSIALHARVRAGLRSCAQW